MFDKNKYYREYNKSYYPKHKDRLNALQKIRRRANPERAMFHKAKARAKQLEREFNIEISDIQIPDRCPILDIPLFAGEGKVGNNSPVLDRIDNSKGYVKGNVAVISHRANILKGDLSLEQIERLLQYAKIGKTWAETH